MPKKDGMGVLKELQSLKIEKNIIVATSYNAPDTIRKVSEYGVNYYILKPFDLTDLEDKILDTFKETQKERSIFFIIIFKYRLVKFCTNWECLLILKDINT